jgi:hypothetical protein
VKALLIATAAFAFGIAPGTARAASGDIGCIEAKLGQAAMQRIGANVVTAVDKGGDSSSVLDTDREALIAARSACRTAGNWSPDAVQAAVSYTQARATKIGAEAALRADGLDPARLAGLYAALPAPDRQSLTGKPSSGALAAVGGATPGRQARVHVRLLFAALAGIEFYPADFANS